MFRALCTNLSGIKAFQHSLDQLSNNISNIDTTAYKGSQVNFSDLIYREIADRRKPAAPDEGALDPQLGKGVRVSANTHSFEPGTLIKTDRALDMAIEGDGFFRVVKPGDDTVAYTRNGSFYLDASGDIVTAQGDFLDVPFNLAALAGEEGEERPPGELEISGEGMVYWNAEDGEREELGQIQLYKFVNKDGLVSDAGGQFFESETSGEPIEGFPGEDGFGEVRHKFQESSNINLSQEMVHMIVTQRALQSNIRGLMTSDELWSLTLQGKS